MAVIYKGPCSQDAVWCRNLPRGYNKNKVEVMKQFSAFQSDELVKFHTKVASYSMLLIRLLRHWVIV